MTKEERKISVIINTYNAAQHLTRVLESAKDFDEIVICDMYSTDQTIEIAKQYNCKIIFHEKMSFCEPARNTAIQAASNKWVLVVDADELISKNLKDYLYEQINKDNCPSAIRIPRKNYFMGKFMHSSYPDYIMRFAKRDAIDWPDHIHSTPIIDGKIETIPSRRKDLAFIHLANDSSETILRKLNTYTEKEIERRKGQQYKLTALIYNPLFRFFKSYILKGGFRDGKAGLAYAGLNAMYKFATVVKLMESNLNEDEIDKDLLG